MPNRLRAHFAAHGGKYTAGGAWIGICISCVSAFEGFASKPYIDRLGKGSPETWCFGETASDDPAPPMSAIFTKPECQAVLGKDLPKYDAQVEHCLTVEAYNALPPHRHAAIVSLTYNIGPGAFCKSSVVRDLNAGHIGQACDDFLAYDRAKGKVLKGLQNRRAAERKLCLMGD